MGSLCSRLISTSNNDFSAWLEHDFRLVADVIRLLLRRFYFSLKHKALENFLNADFADKLQGEWKEKVCFVLRTDKFVWIVCFS